MIACCPKCSARYRVDADRVGVDGAKLRCTKCAAVFLVRGPKPRDAAQEPAPEASPVEETVVSRPDPSEAVEDRVDRERLVLVADPNEERAKQSATAISEWGLIPFVVHDGVDAMLAIQRMLPRVVVLDGALPKMFGFQVCEVMKRNDSLREIRVVLVGAIHHRDRYRRNPSDLYGADVYLEQPDLPDGLLPLLRDAGMPVGNGPGRSSEGAGKTAPAPGPAQAPTPVARPQETAVPADDDPERAAERERAARLARIAVSEMLLYQPEKFDQASRDGNLEQVLDLEIQEARALLRQRIGEEVRGERDFVLDELRRVAAERIGAP
jgi:predicted Zn finger-like uncharacterized protein